MEYFTVSIIGAGPAGVACALQLKKHGVDFAIFEQRHVGGLVKNAFLISNYPGFPEGIRGEDFCESLELQLKNAGVQVFFEKVKKVNPDGEYYLVQTDSGVYRTKFVVVATGTSPKRMPELELSDGVGSRLFYEVIDIPEFQGKDFVVIGSGDAAFDYSLSLVSKGANRVSILLRGDNPHCNNELLRIVKDQDSIQIYTGVVVSEVSRVQEKIMVRGKLSQIFLADYVICAIGRVPNLSAIEHFYDSSLWGRENIFIIGDCNGRAERFVALAVSDGIVSAEKIYRKIMSGG